MTDKSRPPRLTPQTPDHIFGSKRVTTDKPTNVTDKSQLPLVYSCSGCSTAAQMANHFAVELDHQGLAEMSCIAGVGGDVPSLVKVAKAAAESGRPIIAIDGCALTCVKHTLDRHGVVPTVSHELQDYAVRKIKGQNFDPDEANAVLETLILPTIPKTTSPAR